MVLKSEYIRENKSIKILCSERAVSIEIWTPTATTTYHEAQIQREHVLRDHSCKIEGIVAFPPTISDHYHHHSMEHAFCVLLFFFFFCLGGCKTTFMAASKTAFTFCIHKSKKTCSFLLLIVCVKKML